MCVVYQKKKLEEDGGIISINDFVIVSIYIYIVLYCMRLRWLIVYIIGCYYWLGVMCCLFIVVNSGGLNKIIYLLWLINI